jgi:hypothetical protein
VFPQAGRSLRDVSGEVDPGDRDALPVRGLRGHPALIDHRHAESREITYRCAKARRRDDLVAFELELSLPRRATRIDAVAVRVTFNTLDGGVDHVAPTATADVLRIRRQVPDAERREREHCSVYRAR